MRTARAALAGAALDALGEREDEDAVGLRRRFEEERRAATDAESGDGRAKPSGKALLARLLSLQRQRLLDLRRDATIGDDAFHLLEEELDFADLAVRSHV